MVKKSKIAKIFTILITTFFLFSISFILFIKIFNKDNSLLDTSSNLPKNIKFENYIIDIEDTQLYPNFLITKHTIRTKDASNINDNNLQLIIDDNSGTIFYGTGLYHLSTKIINDDKLEVTSYAFIAYKKNDSITISYSLNGVDSLAGKKMLIPNEYTFEENTSTFMQLNNKLTMDDINITVKSIGNFDFGTLLLFYSEDIKITGNNKEFSHLKNRYKIGAHSENYFDKYDIKPIYTVSSGISAELKSLEEYNINANSFYFYYVVIPPNNDFSELLLINDHNHSEITLYKK